MAENKQFTRKCQHFESLAFVYTSYPECLDRAGGIRCISLSLVGDSILAGENVREVDARGSRIHTSERMFGELSREGHIYTVLLGYSVTSITAIMAT